MFTTPEVTVSYPHLFVPVLNRLNKRTEFSAAFLFDQAAYDDPLTVAIFQAVMDCAIAKFGKAAFETMVAEGTFENPFRKDVSSKGYPAARCVRYISSASGQDYPPGVFSRDMDPATKRPKLLTDKREIYPGAIVRASLSPRAYGGPGTTYKPGVKLDLRNVQKLRDGERLAGGGQSDGTEFDALPPLPAAALPAADAAPMAGMLD